VLFAILLLEGFITISVEILVIRQLLPFFGGSVVITSIIIGMFLLFLAMGYWRGGSYHQDFFKRLSRNFICSMLWIGIGLSYSFITLYYYASTYLAKLPFLASLTLYLLIVIAPIVYWLGQTIPLTTNLFNQQNRVSRISGKALFLSTIGSFLGAILTSLLLFQYVGVAWTVVVNCILLFALIMYMRAESQLSWWHVSLILLSLVFIVPLNIATENAQFKLTNNYANYQIVEPVAFSKIMRINLSNSSLLTADKKGFPYIEYVRELLFNQMNLRNKKILVVGGGGFSLTADGVHDNEITYVDIDPDIKEVAEKYFLNKAINGHFIAEDARSYLLQNKSKFDVIFLDAYSNQATVPASLLTLEYFQEIKKHLNPEGLLLINLIANPLFNNDYARIVFNTVHAAFPQCVIVPLSFSHPIANVIYICPKIDTNTVVYSDNLNTSTLDFFKSKEQVL